MMLMYDERGIGGSRNTVDVGWDTHTEIGLCQNPMEIKSIMKKIDTGFLRKPRLWRILKVGMGISRRVWTVGGSVGVGVGVCMW